MDEIVISKSIKCPKCGLITKCEGVPGEKKYITCPKCNTKGIFKFP